MKVEYITLFLRETNRQIIFEEDEDAVRFSETLGEYKEKSGYQVYAYCLVW